MVRPAALDARHDVAHLHDNVVLRAVLRGERGLLNLRLETARLYLADDVVAGCEVRARAGRVWDDGNFAYVGQCALGGEVRLRRAGRRGGRGRGPRRPADSSGPSGGHG